MPKGIPKNNTTKGVKKGTKRGPYKKKKDKVAPEYLSWVQPTSLTETPTEIPLKGSDWEHELNKLRLFCNTFASFSEEERYRAMQFFADKFSAYLPNSK